jgi:alkylation response protein AidB-like acyl-CoA dehydrogenase
MEFTFTEAQTDLRKSVRHYLAARYPEQRIAELADAARHDLAAWPELERQGWLDQDLGMVELAVLAEESGRALHPVAWWATTGLALPAYHAAGTDPAGPATLADGSQTCRASHGGGGWRIEGRVAAVVDVPTATEIVVAAQAGDGVRLFAVPPAGPGVTQVEAAGIDPLRVTSELLLSRAPARLLVGPPVAEPLLYAIRNRGTALLACEGVGVADRALELAVGYARTRVQFGNQIGSYQAVSHLLAESYAELELARSLAYRAVCVLDESEDDPTEALASAVHASNRAAIQVCEAAVQVCGGIGVTWEFPVHWWYRRALWLGAFHTGGPDPLTVIAGLLLG